MKKLLFLIISLTVLPLFSQDRVVEGSISQERESRRVAIYPFDSAQQAAKSVEGEIDTMSSYYRALSIVATQGGAESSFGYLNSWVGRQLKLVVDSSPLPYEVVVNGESVGYSSSGATPALFNITAQAKQGERNSVEFRYRAFEGVEKIEGWSQDNTPITRAYVISQPTLHITNIFQRTTLSQDGVASSMIGVAIESSALGLQQASLSYDVLYKDSVTLTKGRREVSLQMRGSDTVTLSAIVPDSMLWSCENPTLYRLNLMNQRGGRRIEYLSFNIGFREVSVNDGGELHINGRKVEVRAKHIAPNISIEELEELKGEGFNTFIVGAGRYDSKLYQWADSRGAYLIPTAAINSSKGGQTIKRGDNPTNDPAWREVYVSRGVDIYQATQAHPSVIAFAIAESSLNGDNLYHSYLSLKELSKSGSRPPIIYLDSEGQWNSDKLDLNVSE